MFQNFQMLQFIHNGDVCVVNPVEETGQSLLMPVHPLMKEEKI
jgi:hypothetical protein